ncbi:heme exporter protein CcmD [uncultured Methylobacterium sp.]|uniref:heme exporter protein CcmD n=1 Tax=uncultured Methylobacterium sp. TaxID=157278 RepID=UPI0035CC13F0
MDLGSHGGFIVGAYAFTALVVGGLILHALRDARAQRRALAAMQDDPARIPTGEPS